MSTLHDDLAHLLSPVEDDKKVVIKAKIMQYYSHFPNEEAFKKALHESVLVCLEENRIAHAITVVLEEKIAQLNEDNNG
jgi:hypothetical protein